MAVGVLPLAGSPPLQGGVSGGVGVANKGELEGVLKNCPPLPC